MVIFGSIAGLTRARVWPARLHPLVSVVCVASVGCVPDPLLSALLHFDIECDWSHKVCCLVKQLAYLAS